MNGGVHEHSASRPDETTDCGFCAYLGYATWGEAHYLPRVLSTSEGEGA